MTSTRPTVEEYAAALVDLISRDVREEPDRFTSARNFDDLDDVCDANEYLIAADERTGNPSPFDAAELNDDDLDAYLVFTSAAIDQATAILWPTR